MRNKDAKKILIVDDDTTHRLMLKANLSSDEYNIFEAENGEVAIQMVNEEFFDLIMLDPIEIWYSIPIKCDNRATVETFLLSWLAEISSKSREFYKSRGGN